MSRRMKTILGSAGAVALIGVVALWSTLRYGFSAHDEPTRMEEIAARAIRHWSVPAELRAAKNPLPLTPRVLADARAHWADHCATCHGNDGKGKTTVGEHLYPRAPDMTLAQTQELSDGELFAVIENGIRLTGMPGWGEGTAASGYGSWALVHMIRRLPSITPEELDEMAALNPKTPEEWEQAKEEKQFLEGAPADAGDSAKHRADHQHEE